MKVLPKAAWTEDRKLQRQEKWLYPPKAIREALANALAHRDYESPANVQVRIFDDRIEIWNPGELPKEIILADLEREHPSIPRNPLVANCLFLVRYIEQWGTGTNRIINDFRAERLPDPDFSIKAGSFVVTLRGHKDILEVDARVDARVDAKLTDNERRILKFISTNKRMDSSELQSLFGISREMANRYFKKLIEKGLITRKGLGRSTYYTLKGKMPPKNDRQLRKGLKKTEKRPKKPKMI